MNLTSMELCLVLPLERMQSDSGCNYKVSIFERTVCPIDEVMRKKKRMLMDPDSSRAQASRRETMFRG
jgi:hypothetical protein